jgi:hypothetical protein
MKARNRPVENDIPTIEAETPSNRAREVLAQGTAKVKKETQPSKAKARPSRRAITLTHEQIKERARAPWLKSGCLPGRDEANWREAEAQLKAELGID